MENATHRPVWFRLPSESGKAYDAFTYYLFMPSESRSVDAAYREAKKQQKGSKRAAGQWTAYASQYQWKERADAYDDHIAARLFLEQEESIRKVTQERLRRAEFLEKRENEAAQKLFDLADKLLGYPTQKVVTLRDGKEVHIHPAKWTVSSVARLLEIGSKLGRLSAGMPTDVTKGDVTGTLNEVTDLILETVKEVSGVEAYEKLGAALKQKWQEIQDE